MASWWRKAVLGATTAVSLATSAVFDYLGYNLAALVTLLTAVAAGGLSLAIVMRRIGDSVAQARSIARSVHQANRSAAKTTTAHADQLESVSAEITILRGQLELVTHAVKEGGAQNERILQSMRQHFDQGLAETRSLISNTGQSRDTQEAQLGHQAQSDILQEIEALLRLRAEYPVRFESPLLWNYALSPRGMWQVVSLARERQPSTIVELGSGLSTLYLSRCVANRPGSMIYCLEHKVEYLEATKQLLEAHDASENVRLIHAPLVDTDIGDRTFAWYSVGDYLPPTIDLLLVDGPPGASGPLARLPALERLNERLQPGSIIVLDDTHRDDEREIARRWVRDFRLRRHHSLTPRQMVLERPVRD